MDPYKPTLSKTPQITQTNTLDDSTTPHNPGGVSLQLYTTQHASQ